MDNVTSPSRAADLTTAEQPSASARLEFSVGPAEARGRAEARVRARDAPALIKTFGVIGMSAVGITGAVVTVRAAPPLAPVWSFGLALAELALTALGMLLITGRHRPWGGSRRRTK
jgi:hypothetical protein